MDHFERLGLERTATIDAAELERCYIAKSREVHPDLHGDDQVVAAAALNEAYRVLADPWRRYAYLAELRCPGVMEANKTLCPIFLAETMEHFEEAHEAETEAAREAIRERVRAELASYAARIESLLADQDGAEEAAVLCHQARYAQRTLETLSQHAETKT